MQDYDLLLFLSTIFEREGDVTVSIVSELTRIITPTCALSIGRATSLKKLPKQNRGVN